MKTYGYGVVGCGRVSARHMNAAEALPNAELVAVSNHNIDKAYKAVEGREATPAVYQDYNDLLANPKVDVVVVCIPTQFHEECVLAAAKAGKHVFCEKAMAPTIGECRNMIHACDDAGVKLTVGQNTRYFSTFAQARRLVEAGEIGDIIALDGAFVGQATLPDNVPANFWRFTAGAQGHGYVVNFGAHYIDTARAICGKEPKQVSAWIANRYSAGQIPEDQFAVTTVCDDGTVINIAMYCTLDRVAARNHGFTIYGTKGIIYVAYWPDNLKIQFGTEDPVDVPIDDDLRRDPWHRFHGEFLACIENDTTPPVTGRDGMLNVQWALAAYLANQRRAWMDLPLGPEFYEYGGPKLYESVPAGS